MTPMNDEDHRICELEKEIAVLKAQKADSDRVAHAFWAAIVAILLALVELAVTLLQRR
jgi:hypothetical protein